MTDCLQCGLSLQGRDNESQTCSDCLLGLTDESYSTIEGVIRQTINEPVMNEDKEKYSGDLYGYEVMLRVLDEETWIVDVRDEVTDEYVDGYEFENYDEAVAEYTKQVHHLCNHKEPSIYAWNQTEKDF